MKFNISLSDVQSAYALRHEPEQYIHFARVYWSGLVTTVAILIILSIGYGAWEFFKPLPQPSLEAGKPGIVGFDRANLTKVVDVFEARRAAFETMMTGE